jgi:hypothetical protein
VRSKRCNLLDFFVFFPGDLSGIAWSSGVTASVQCIWRCIPLVLAHLNRVGLSSAALVLDIHIVQFELVIATKRVSF